MVYQMISSVVEIMTLIIAMSEPQNYVRHMEMEA